MPTGRDRKQQLRFARDREHLLVGIALAQESRAEVIAIIGAAKSAEDARDSLMAALGLDAQQVVAVLDMQFRRVAELERRRITDELDQLRRDIDVLATDEGSAGDGR